MIDNFSEELVDVGVALVDFLIKNETVIEDSFAWYSGDFIVANKMHYNLLSDSVRRLCPNPKLTDSFEFAVMRKSYASLNTMFSKI